MASKTVCDAVEARIGATWTATDTTAVPVYGTNTSGTPPIDGSSFITVQYPTGAETLVGLAGVGNRTFRETGTIRIVLSTMAGEGVIQALTWIDELRVLFRAAQFGGVSCLSPSPPTIDDRSDAGNYYKLSFVCPYYYDFYA